MTIVHWILTISISTCEDDDHYVAQYFVKLRGLLEDEK